MSAISTEEIKREFLKSRIGLAGIGILLILVITSIVTVIIIPVDTFKQWNNPSYWISFPKTSTPVWVNILTFEKIPEHQIIDEPIINSKSGYVSVVNHQFNVNFDYDGFPSDFIYEFTAKYSGSPLLQISVIRPDGMELDLLSTSLPNSKTTIIHSERIFSTDSSIKKNLFLQKEQFSFPIDKMSSEDVIFSNSQLHGIQKGNYIFLVNLFGVQTENEILDSRLIVGGKAFGMMGTDELRRDLAIGLLLGTPLALFIGLAVAIG